MEFSAIDRAKALAGTAFGLSVVLAGLSSCALRPPSDTFDLSAVAQTQIAEPRAQASRLQILVPTPSAIQVLDSRNVVVRLGGAELRYLANAQWSDQLPVVIQSRLVAGLENTGFFGGVGIPGQGLAIDYQVVVEVREFAIDAAGLGAADVMLSVKLLNDRSGVVKAQRLFSASVPVNANSSNRVLIAAMDQAFVKAQTDIVSWIASIL